MIYTESIHWRIGVMIWLEYKFCASTNYGGRSAAAPASPSTAHWVFRYSGNPSLATHRSQKITQVLIRAKWCRYHLTDANPTWRGLLWYTYEWSWWRRHSFFNISKPYGARRIVPVTTIHVREPILSSGFMVHSGQTRFTLWESASGRITPGTLLVNPDRS